MSDDFDWEPSPRRSDDKKKEKTVFEVADQAMEEKAKRETELVKKFASQSCLDDGRTLTDVMNEVIIRENDEYINRPGGVRGEEDMGFINEVEARLRKEHPQTMAQFDSLTEKEHLAYTQENDHTKRRLILWRGNPPDGYP